MIWFWQQREQLECSLNWFYHSLSVSKQAVHQMLGRYMKDYELRGYLLALVAQIRKDHPTMSCRALYYKIQPKGLGRDKFESFCQQMGFGIEQPLSYCRTTDSSGVVRFDNLLAGMALTAVNQAFSSDITYYALQDRFYYITFILDCYSRAIIGHSVSKRLLTEETTLPALQMAIRTRGGQLPEGMVFHSDGGGQYYDKAFLALTKKHKINNSMCEYAYENGKAERVNGVIKNNYLRHWAILSYSELVKSVDRAVKLYNYEKPHKALKYLTPMDFEKQSLLLT